MNPLRVDHTAIVVRDLDESLQLYARLYGVEPPLRRTLPEQRVEVAFLPFGDTEIELIQPTDDDSGVARFLARRGEGVHHIGLLVEDIRTELRDLEEKGARLIDREPRQGAHGLIAFLHPSSTGGVLYELVERASDEALQA